MHTCDMRVVLFRRIVATTTDPLVTGQPSAATAEFDNFAYNANDPHQQFTPPPIHTSSSSFPIRTGQQGTGLASHSLDLFDDLFNFDNKLRRIY